MHARPIPARLLPLAAQIAADYQRPETVTALAEQYGTSTGTICAIIRHQGVAVRPRSTTYQHRGTLKPGSLKIVAHRSRCEATGRECCFTPSDANCPSPPACRNRLSAQAGIAGSGTGTATMVAGAGHHTARGRARE